MSDTHPDALALARSTEVIILAAGLGSRLGPNTAARPKCLVPVNGTPILQRMVDSLLAHGVEGITVAIGYLGDQIRQFFAERYAGLRVNFVENPNYAATGSVFSLDLALDAVDPAAHLLLVEGDVVCEPELIRRTFASAAQASALTVLSPYEPSLSGTFALTGQGRVAAWLHESVRTPDFPLAESFKTVNISFLRAGQPAQALRAAVKHTIVKGGVKAPLEYAMQDLVSQGLPIEALETAGLRWFEIDTPEDLAIAEDLFPPLDGSGSAGTAGAGLPAPGLPVAAALG